jgi:uncharacterized membrane protein
MIYIYWFVLVWIISAILGAISLPISSFIFGYFSDKGYAFSRLISLFVISYISFFLTTIKIAPLPTVSLIVSVVLWVLINFFIFFKKIEKDLPSLKDVIITEAIFIIAFIGFLFIKSFQPEIYQIERFMDFGFIQALKNTTFLPIEDIWFSGEFINYYYFGHFIGFVFLSLTFINTVPGFYLLGGLIFSLLAITVFRLGSDFLTLFIKENKNTIYYKAAGFISLFFVILSGSWYMIFWIFKKIISFFGIIKDPLFFFPEPTRIIPGTITEMPIYSFIVADLHAHVWGMLSTVLIIAVLYSWWRDNKTRLNFYNFYFWSLSFLLGTSYMISSFDALTLGTLSVVFLIFKNWKESKIRILFFSAFLAIFAYLIALPWSIFINIPIKGIGFVTKGSPILPWISFWGSSIAIFLIYISWKYFFRKDLKFKNNLKHIFPEIIIGTGIFFLILIEFFYIKDIMFEGEWFRANTVFKITTQVWIWINVFMGPIFISLYYFIKKKSSKIIFIFLFSIYFLIGLSYPTIAIWQSSFNERKITGINSGLNWWKEKYHDDYQAYLFLDNIRTSSFQLNKMKRIVEAEGESYTDVSRFSVFLGWPTIVGWPVHQWTWRGSYHVVGKRRAEVREIYTGTNLELSKSILDKYNIDYIIIGQVEKTRYFEEIQMTKLLKLGKVIFEYGETIIIEYSKK